MKARVSWKIKQEGVWMEKDKRKGEKEINKKEEDAAGRRAIKAKGNGRRRKKEANGKKGTWVEMGKKKNR